MESDTLKSLDKILDEHALWIMTQGKKGKLANLEGRNLNGLNIKSVDLPFAKLQSASLKNSNLPGANFSHADLSKVNFHSCSPFGVRPRRRAARTGVCAQLEKSFQRRLCRRLL